MPSSPWRLDNRGTLDTHYKQTVMQALNDLPAASMRAHSCSKLKQDSSRKTLRRKTGSQGVNQMWTLTAEFDDNSAEMLSNPCGIERI